MSWLVFVIKLYNIVFLFKKMNLYSVYVCFSFSFFFNEFVCLLIRKLKNKMQKER